MIRELKAVEAEGHLLGGAKPTTTNIYMHEICITCDQYIEDGVKILKGRFGYINVVICQNCAYIIHSAYETNL